MITSCEIRGTEIEVSAGHPFGALRNILILIDLVGQSPITHARNLVTVAENGLRPTLHFMQRRAQPPATSPEMLVLEYSY